MARSCYSVVFDQSADAVWSCIRSFGDYAWAGVTAEVTLEDGKRGDQVGVVRRIRGDGRDMRQVLLAHSDIDRCYSYAFQGPTPYPVSNYMATIRILPVVEGDRAFVEWSATFDCAEAERQHWTSFFAEQGFANWLAALRRTLSVAA